MGKQTKQRGLGIRRFFLKLLCLVLAVILTGMVGITLWTRALMNRMGTSDPETILPVLQNQLEEFVPEGTPDREAGISGSRKVINILLIGQDRRPGEEQARSDAMILCTIHKQSKQVTMTSFLRDLYVPIPGHQDNRLNAAYAYGGIQLLTETIETNFDIRIDGCVEVDFAQFANIVDILGGVTIDLRADEAQTINHEVVGNLTEGSCLLNGKQALSYARIRSLDGDGDFSRTNRQRKVLKAVLEECSSADRKTMLVLLADILPEITTDMSNLKIMGYGLELFPMLGEMTVVSQHIPADGTYSAQMIRDMSVLVADMDAARELLEETMQGQ